MCLPGFLPVTNDDQAGAVTGGMVDRSAPRVPPEVSRARLASCLRHQWVEQSLIAAVNSDYEHTVFLHSVVPLRLAITWAYRLTRRRAVCSRVRFNETQRCPPSAIFSRSCGCRIRVSNRSASASSSSTGKC